MIIQTQLSEKEYVQVILAMLYSKPATKILAIIGAGILITVLLQLIFKPESFDASNLFVAFIFLVFRPLVVYFSAKSNYKSNHQLSEKITYHIDDDKLLIEGETYNITLTWNNILKVNQTKKWIIIWQSANKSFPISIHDLWAGDIAGIKDILETNKVKNNLKYLP